VQFCPTIFKIAPPPMSTDWQSSHSITWPLSFRGHKTGAFKHLRAFHFQIGFCPHLCSWILGNDWKSAISGTSDRDGIFAKSSQRDASRQSAQMSNSENTKYAATSLNRKSPTAMVHHVIKMPQERLARRVLLATHTGKRPRHRPRTRWVPQERRNWVYRMGLAATLNLEFCLKSLRNAISIGSIVKVKSLIKKQLVTFMCSRQCSVDR